MNISALVVTNGVTGCVENEFSRKKFSKPLPRAVRMLSRPLRKFN